MSQRRTLVRICHLDDEPWILSFLPRRIHLEVVRKIDADASLTEPSITDPGDLSFLIDFKRAKEDFRIEYVFYSTVAAFLNEASGFVRKLQPYERNAAVVFDLRIGEEQNAGRTCFQAARSKLAPHTEVDWLFLTAYPGSIDLEDPNFQDRIFAKPPNRNDLFARIYAALREF